MPSSQCSTAPVGVQHYLLTWLQDLLFHTHKQVSPHLLTAKKHGIKTWAQSKKHGLKVWLASKKHTNTFLSSPQVSLLRVQAGQVYVAWSA